MSDTVYTVMNARGSSRFMKSISFWYSPLSTMVMISRRFSTQVIEMPSIHTVAIDPNERLKKALGEIQHSEKEEWFVFTSPIGVHVFFEQLEKEWASL